LNPQSGGEITRTSLFSCLFEIFAKRDNLLLVDSLDMENSEYSEWVPIGALVKGLMVMVSSIIVFVTFAVFLLSEKLLVEDVFGVAFAWGILAFILFVFWNFRGLRIQIKGDTLSVVYGMFNKKSFLLKEIASCQKTKTFGRYLGVGVRYGLDGSTAYTTSFGEAVAVAPKVGRTFVFSSNKPDKVCEIIKNGMHS
jgi:hypothetical protein